MGRVKSLQPEKDICDPRLMKIRRAWFAYIWISQFVVITISKLCKLVFIACGKLSIFQIDYERQTMNN